jgi:hypothetical protein
MELMEKNGFILTGQKADKRSNIPLLLIASAILEKYKYQPQFINEEKLLQSPNNQKIAPT